jgi:hypothetical protein
MGKPAIGMNVDGRLDIFATSSSGNVFHDSQSSPGSFQYAGWSLIGEQKKGNPAVGQDVDGKLRVFVHGLNDNLLYEKIQQSPNGDTYSTDWIPMGGDLKASIDHTVATNDDGRLELFAVFNNNDLYHKYQLSLLSPGTVN